MPVIYRGELGWGLCTAINLTDCNSDKINSRGEIEDFVKVLCDDILKVKRYGDTQLAWFGEDDAIAGYSMTQLIETSLVSGHFVSYNNSAYLDVFSCKTYNPDMAAEYSKQFFEARDMNFDVLIRE